MENNYTMWYIVLSTRKFKMTRLSPLIMHDSFDAWQNRPRYAPAETDVHGAGTPETSALEHAANEPTMLPPHIANDKFFAAASRLASNAPNTAKNTNRNVHHLLEMTIKDVPFSIEYSLLAYEHVPGRTETLTIRTPEGSVYSAIKRNHNPVEATAPRPDTSGVLSYIHKAVCGFR